MSASVCDLFTNNKSSSPSPRLVFLLVTSSNKRACVRPSDLPSVRLLVSRSAENEPDRDTLINFF